MRCPDCLKFTGLETQVDVNDGPDMKASKDGIDITAEVTVNRNCSDCGTTLKLMNFSTEKSVEFPIECVDGSVLDSMDDIDGESLEMDAGDAEEYESGGGRYAKNMVGFDLTCTFKGNRKKASKGKPKEFEFEVILHEDEQASAYEEQV